MRSGVVQVHFCRFGARRRTDSIGPAGPERTENCLSLCSWGLNCLACPGVASAGFQLASSGRSCPDWAVAACWGVSGLSLISIGLSLRFSPGAGRRLIAPALSTLNLVRRVIGCVFSWRWGSSVGVWWCRVVHQRSLLGIAPGVIWPFIRLIGIARGWRRSRGLRESFWRRVTSSWWLGGVLLLVGSVLFLLVTERMLQFLYDRAVPAVLTVVERLPSWALGDLRAIPRPCRYQRFTGRFLGFRRCFIDLGRGSLLGRASFRVVSVAWLGLRLLGRLLLVGLRGFGLSLDLLAVFELLLLRRQAPARRSR